METQLTKPVILVQDGVAEYLENFVLFLHSELIIILQTNPLAGILHGQ